MKFLNQFRMGTFVWALASFAVAGSALFFAWQKIGNAGIAVSVYALDVRFAALAGVLYAVTLFFRAIRFYVFFRAAVSIRLLSRVVAFHSFWNNVLPFRAGEFSYLYLIRKHAAVTDGENVVSLVAARMFDAAIVLAALFVSSLVLFSRMPDFSGPAILASAAIVLFLICAVILGILFKSRIRERIVKFEASRKGELPSWALFLFSKAREVARAIGSLRARSHLGVFFLLSCLVWLFDLFSVWAAFGAAGIALGAAQAVFMAAFPVFATLIPFQTPLGLGTFEATIGSGLFFLGVPVGRAIFASALLHAQYLLFSVIAFLTAHGIRKARASVVS